MRHLILLVFPLTLALPAAGQPADCPSEPAPTQTVPLWLDLPGLPGVPRGISGQVFADVPVAPPGGTLCTPAASAGPRDVLRGEPGNVLRGQRTDDLLRGPARPRVEIGFPQKPDGR
jgi:hypothetical protein